MKYHNRRARALRAGSARALRVRRSRRQRTAPQRSRRCCRWGVPPRSPRRREYAPRSRARAEGASPPCWSVSGRRASDLPKEGAWRFRCGRPASPTSPPAPMRRWRHSPRATTSAWCGSASRSGQKSRR
eukprot:scaffold12211_cov116-Isochrysis_galbana.AAC.4